MVNEISKLSSYSSLYALEIARKCSLNQKNIIICPTETIAESLYNDIIFLNNNNNLLFLPDWDILPYENISPQIEVSAKRVAILSEFFETNKSLILSVTAFFQKTIPFEYFKTNSFVLHPKYGIEFLDIQKFFKKVGYQKSSLVEYPCQYSCHEKIIDFFPINSEHPIRLEFKDGVLSNIRNFDINSQRSITTLAEVKVYPAKEIFFFNEQELNTQIENKIKSLLENLQITSSKKKSILEKITSDNLLSFPFEHLVSFFNSKLTSLYDKFTDNLYFIDKDLCLASYQNFQSSLIKRYDKYKETRLIANPNNIYEPLDSFKNIVSKLSDKANITLKNTDKFLTNKDLVVFQNNEVGKNHPLIKIISHYKALGYKIALVCKTELREQRILNILKETSFVFNKNNTSLLEWLVSPKKDFILQNGSISGGFKILDKKIIVLAEQEIFHKISERKKTNEINISLKKLLGTLSQLEIGDYLVHEDYGIGIYQGLKNLEIAGNKSEFLQINYADSKLYLPVQKIGIIQKYNALEGKIPVIDKLSSKKWITTKQKVQKSVSLLAGDLIKLYAKRMSIETWQADSKNIFDDEFADNFPFNETEDQLKAINETLNDLTLGRPMDRLICGDVGFGKTEVALRASFKTIMSGKQVALIAPTTILVDQHLKTFQERLENFSIKVGGLSRFFTAKENKKTINDLATGKINIVIGTHKLLNRDIKFKDLGLLIIDEEHRFGVKQKETLKQYKADINVLTLTATPIPRTLYMSLINIRDVSVINTPPVNRKSIKTHISNYSEDLITDAITKEVERGGQVFYVHNRIKNIAMETEKLKSLMPNVKFEFTHAKMHANEIEEKIHKFINKEFDVLVTTTIIESGIDIPNANTLIINRADTFGLAQLYQLRGRVGRSNVQAYAYLLVKELKKVTFDAKKRLEALRAIDDLGQGFQLAMRDLEIRGAGNVLGKEQSGNVFLVGYELYTKILNNAILHLQNKEKFDDFEPEVKISCPAYIPNFYIPEDSERLILYQRLTSISSKTDAQNLQSEIADRFGAVPLELENYIIIMLIRDLLKKVGVYEMTVKDFEITIKPRQINNFNIDKVIEICQNEPNVFRLGSNGILKINSQTNFLLSLNDLYIFLVDFFSKTINA